MKLSEISNELIHLDDALEANDDPEILEAAAIAYFEQEGALEKKLENCGHYLMNMKAACERLKRKREVMENKQKRFREYIKFYMQKHNIKKIPCDEFNISLSDGRGSVEILNEEKIPAKFIEIVTTNKIKKAEINKALKSGETVDGAVLVKNQTLTIR